MRKPIPFRFLPGLRHPPAPAPHARILLLEDEDSVRAVLAEALFREGFGVFAGASREQGQAILQAVGWRNIDLVLADTHLSREAYVRNGFAFHADWRSLYPVPPFIFMDGWGNTGRPSVPREDNCQVYGLTKPFSLPVLLSLIGAVLGP